MTAPVVRTHSVRRVAVGRQYIAGMNVPVWALQCRGCGEEWDLGAAVEVLERQPCGTPEGEQ